jgi:homopolymeric O-antigen transport system ATP-binding protein
MTDKTIQVENLSKRYRLGQTQTLRMRLAQAVNRIKRGGAEQDGTNPDEFWALRDVSLDVRPGEVLGLIGRNGAGKSTLLKILSRITDPTHGQVTIHGRVGSLLEVGTGFHPELTGRENIFLNGAILGMKRAEISKQFDQIVDFAEVGRFLDTPVKRYSSGMYVRLAFAVAAHLEPEVLLIDEVLAVGDAAFQRKCLGKMGDVAKRGRTVVFVSHNMAAVSTLCDRSVLLEDGQVSFIGDTEQAVQRYLQHSNEQSPVALADRQDRAGSGAVRLTGITIQSTDNPEQAYIQSGDSLRVTIRYESNRPVKRPRFLVGIYDPMNQPLFRLDTQVTEQIPDTLPAKGEVVCETGPLMATAGVCYVNVAVQLGEEMADHVSQATSFGIEPADVYKTGRGFDRKDSLFLLPQKWRAQAA